MKTLKDIADVRTGYPFRERPERVSGNGVKMVQMRDIDSATGCVGKNLERVETPANWESHRLRAGDVLLAARGERNNAAQFTISDDEAVAASNLLVLRLKPTGDVTPDYLAWYLNLPQTQERLRTGRAGSNIPFIPIEELARLPIRVPPIEVQNQIVNLLELNAEEQRLMTQIQEKRRELMAGVLQSLLTNQITV